MNLSALLRRDAAAPPVVIRTPLSIYDISQNLRSRANDSRDWAIPDDLRRIGIDKLILEGVGDELTLEWGGRTNPVNNPACFLKIVSLAAGGSEVTVRFGRGTLRVFALLALLASPFEVVGDESGLGRWLFVAMQAVVSAGFLLIGSTRKPLLEAHLMKIVEHATRGRGVPAGDRGLPRSDTVSRLSP